jgi:8-oxo-dGTP diphosphatase
MTDETAITEEEFLRNYDPRAYAPVAVTVDLTIFTIRNSKLSILLIKRGGHPELGKWALPGGFVNVDESLDQAAARELREETSLTIEDGYLEQLRTYGYPGRDPRGYVVSTAYVALAPHVTRPTAGDDAAEAHFFPVEDVLSEDFALAFDHGVIIRDGLERVRAKLEYQAIAHHFLEDEAFTLTELRRVYEIVWGAEVVASNFRRKLHAIPQLLEPVGSRRTSEVEGGRSSDLFRAGPVREIFPPLRRPEENNSTGL